MLNGGTTPEALPKEMIVPLRLTTFMSVSQVSFPIESKIASTPLPLVISKTFSPICSYVRSVELSKNSAPFALALANFSSVEATAITCAFLIFPIN